MPHTNAWAPNTTLVAGAIDGDSDAPDEQLLGILGPLRGEIVEVEADATGTPLPATYQAAPALVG